MRILQKTVKHRNGKQRMNYQNFILLVSLLLTVSTNQQGITFFHFSRDKCYLEGDDIIIDSKINISGKLLTQAHQKFEVKLPNSNYQLICSLDLNKCIGYELANCYCENTGYNDTFDVTINISGLAQASEAFLRGSLTILYQNIWSEEIKLPKIYDASKVTAFLYINHKIISLDSCDESINGTDVNFVFFLNNSDDLPRRLKITDSRNITLQETSLIALSHSAKVYESQTFIFSYEFCGSDKSKRRFVCNIKTEQPRKNVRLSVNNKNVNITNCEETVNSSEVNIVFSVRDSKRSVKRLSIIGDETGETVESHSFLLLHSAHFRGIRWLTLTYELVGQDEKIIHCSIQAGVELHVDVYRLKENSTPVIIINIVILLLNVTVHVANMGVFSKDAIEKNVALFQKEMCNVLITEDFNRLQSQLEDLQRLIADVGEETTFSFRIRTLARRLGDLKKEKEHDIKINKMREEIRELEDKVTRIYIPVFVSPQKRFDDLRMNAANLETQIKDHKNECYAIRNLKQAVSDVKEKIEYLDTDNKAAIGWLPANCLLT